MHMKQNWINETQFLKQIILNWIRFTFESKKQNIGSL